MKTGKTVGEIHVGDSVNVSRTLSGDDVRRFEAAIGDAVCSGLKETPASGFPAGTEAGCEMLTVGLIYAVIGSLLPGPGTRYLSQTLHFRQPVSAGDTITVSVTVRDKAEMSNWVALETTCRNQRGEIVTEGEAIVMPPVR